MRGSIATRRGAQDTFNMLRDCLNHSTAPRDGATLTDTNLIPIGNKSMETVDLIVKVLPSPKSHNEKRKRSPLYIDRNHSQAVKDLNSSLEKHKGQLPYGARQTAQVQYQLGVTLAYRGQFNNVVRHLNDTIQIISGLPNYVIKPNYVVNPIT